MRGTHPLTVFFHWLNAKAVAFAAVAFTPTNASQPKENSPQRIHPEFTQTSPTSYDSDAREPIG
jgi:hypothetical protein